MFCFQKLLLKKVSQKEYMLSVQKCKELLIREGINYSDKEIEQLRDFLYILARIDIENFKRKLHHEQKSHSIHQGIYG